MAEKNYIGPPLITVDLSNIELNLLKLNLETANAAIIQRAIDWAVAAGIDVLEHALPMTPWDTGRLRKSGTVTADYGIGRVDVARGTKSGTVKFLSGLNKLTPQLSKRLRKRVKSIRAIVHFSRAADSSGGPRDIALWTHENLNTYDSRPNPPAATKPGTGPKYLEKAGRMRSGIWLKKAMKIGKIIERDVKDMTTVQSGRLKGPHIVKRIRLKLNKLKRFLFLRGR